MVYIVEFQIFKVLNTHVFKVWIEDSIIENQQKGAEKSGVWILEEKPLIWAMCEKKFYGNFYFFLIIFGKC